jgi:murein DD-endopeptidase MepM/ murein hydrolase activator NlpD
VEAIRYNISPFITHGVVNQPKESAQVRQIIVFIMFIASLWGAQISELIWKKGETFSDYLQHNGVPLELVKNISPEDAKYLSEIQAGESFYELREGETLLQTLIPIGEEMQIQLARDLRSGKYRFDIIPIVYREVEDRAVVEIRKSCYVDIDRMTRNPRLGFLLKHLYKGAVDFRKLRRGDRVAFAYRQKSRLGEPWGQPEIKGAVIESGKKRRFIFVDEEGNAWNDIHKTVRYTKTGKREVVYTVTKTVRGSRRKTRFGMPIKRGRITSRFSYKRWHPILHRYRPHLGVDWGAKRGTPLYAVAKGRVIYAGWMRGYGKVVKIDHGEGFVTLYAHQSRLKVRRGSYVRKGQVIGYVGNTGRSTGPHLHFGLYRNGRAVNPLRYLAKSAKTATVRKVTTRHKKMKSYTIVKTKKVPIKGARLIRDGLLKALEEPPTAYRWERYEASYVRVGDRERYRQEKKGRRWAAK